MTEQAANELPRDVIIATLKDGRWPWMPRAVVRRPWFPSSFADDREVVAACVANRYGGYTLNRVSARLRSDREIVRTAVAHHRGSKGFSVSRLHGFPVSSLDRRWNFKYATDELKDDFDFVVSLLEEGFNVYEDVSSGLKGRRDVSLIAVHAAKCSIAHLPVCFRGDMVIAEASIRNGEGIRFLPEHLRRDPALVRLAVELDGRCLADASVELLGDKGIALIAMKTCDMRKYGIHVFHPLKFVDASLRSDVDVVTTAVERWGEALEHASVDLRASYDVVLKAVTTEGLALEFASDELRADRHIVLAAVTQNGEAICHAARKFRRDKEIVMVAVTSNTFALEYASKKLRANRAVVFHAVVQGGGCIDYVHGRFRENPLLQKLADLRTRPARNWHMFKARFKVQKFTAWLCAVSAKDEAHFDEDGMAVLVGRDAVSAKRDYDSAFALLNGCE